MQNMGANIITEQWESIGNEGFIASTGYMSIRDFRVDSEGNSQSHQYSTSLLGTSAVNPVTENQDIAFSYFNNLNINNINNLLNGDSGNDPSFSLFFKSIPEAGSSGTATINFLLANGRDSIISEGSDYTQYFNVDATASIASSLTFNWESDGENVSITIPDQENTVTLTNIADGSQETRVFNAR